MPHHHASGSTLHSVLHAGIPLMLMAGPDDGESKEFIITNTCTGGTPLFGQMGPCALTVWVYTPVCHAESTRKQRCENNAISRAAMRNYATQVGSHNILKCLS